MAKKQNVGLTRIRVEAYNRAMDGRKVKAIRKAAGLSLADAGKRLGWTPQRWADIEAGRHPNPRIGTLLAVCKVIGCEVVDVLRKQQ